MHPFDCIVLAIPHATGSFDASLWSNQAAVMRDARRWTDWHTDRVFTDAAHDEQRIRAVIGHISRFDCDLERLEDDPLEIIGQGRLYTKSHSGAVRTVPMDKSAQWLQVWREYREQIVSAAADASRPLLLDCHSFPADLAPAVDVCLGWNEDASRPPDEVIATAQAAFQSQGFRVACNIPYGNSILPESWHGPTMLVELNKAIYLNERNLSLLPSANRVGEALHRLYEMMLGLS